jgi:hypothetical protein
MVGHLLVPSENLPGCGKRFSKSFAATRDHADRVDTAGHEALKRKIEETNLAKEKPANRIWCVPTNVLLPETRKPNITL